MACENPSLPIADTIFRALRAADLDAEGELAPDRGRDRITVVEILEEGAELADLLEVVVRLPFTGDRLAR